MQQSPSSGTKSHAHSQETPCLLLNSKVHYRAHKSPSLVHILNQTKSVHTLPGFYFLSDKEFNILNDISHQVPFQNLMQFQ
jgi:hypothetical protein